MLVCIAFFMGCSNGSGIPTAPAADNTISGQSANAPSQTHLWGYYDIYLDISSKSAEVVYNRNAAFAANVTTCLNGNPANLGLKIHGVATGPGDSYVDVDVDVKLTHPYPGLTQYNGYDVRGIFMGNGTKVMNYNPKLRYAAYESLDQVMYDYDADMPGDPYTGRTGDPDGYTRWWNPMEFPKSGLFGYTKGAWASKNYTSTASLNPYKYFADGLSADGNLWNFLTTTKGNGVFSAGSSNTRNYYLRFPVPYPNVKFSYAVIANWKGVQPQDHPSNASEAIALSVEQTPHVFYESPSKNGGKIKLDISVFDWDSQLSNGVMSDYKIIVESTVLSAPYVLNNSEMTPKGGGVNYSTYHVEIPADKVTSTKLQEYWVIVEDQNNNYKNDYGVSNLCGDDKLAAFFRHDLFVSDKEYNQIPVIVSGVSGPENPAPTSTQIYKVVANDPDGDSLVYNWKVTDKATGMPDPYYNNLPGDPPGSLSIDWFLITGVAIGKQYDISCTVTDGKSAPVQAKTLTATMTTDNIQPVIQSGVNGEQSPQITSVEVYEVIAYDANGDTLGYRWKVTDFQTGLVDPSYNNVQGNPPGYLSINWSIISGILSGKKYWIDCAVTDGKSAWVHAKSLLVTIKNNPPVVNSGVNGDANPVLEAVKYYTVSASDIDPGDVVSYSWTVKDKATGNPISGYNGVPGAPPGTLLIYWSSTYGFSAGKQYEVTCQVTDNKSAPVAANPLNVLINSKPVAQFSVLTEMPMLAYEEAPVVFQSYSYDPDPEQSMTLTYQWDFDGDYIYNEPDDDSIDLGTSINPTHIYKLSYVGSVNHRVVDIHGAISNVASSPVNVTVDNCSYDLPTTHSWSTSQVVTNGNFTANTIAPMPTRASNPMRIIYPYGTNMFGACNAGSGGNYNYVANSAVNPGNHQIYRAVITSTDRIIYCDAGANNMLYYTDWTGSAFGSMRNPWPSGSGVAIPNYNPGNIAPASRPWRIAITDDNRPIILVPYTVSGSTLLVMYIWNGTNWGSPINLPNEIRTAIGGDWALYSSNLWDMDYDPTTGFVLIVTRWNFFEGIFAISQTGVLKWSETNIWTPANNTTRLGVEVPKFGSKCRIVIFMGNDTYNNAPGMSRANPLGGVIKNQWLTSHAGSNDIDNGYYACLVPPNGTVTRWRLWGGSGYSADRRHYVYRDMPAGF